MDNEIQIIEREQEESLEIKINATAMMLPVVIGKSYKKIAQYLESIKTEAYGAPYTRYLNVEWDKDGQGNKLLSFIKMFTKKWDMLIGFPVKNKVNGVNDIHPGTIPGGRYVKAIHHGAYQKVGKTYAQITSWIKQEKITVGNESLEIYLNDPKTTRKDNLETIVLIPIVD